MQGITSKIGLAKKLTFSNGSREIRTGRQFDAIAYRLRIARSDRTHSVRLMSRRECYDRFFSLTADIADPSVKRLGREHQIELKSIQNNVNINVNVRGSENTGEKSIPRANLFFF